MAGRPPFTATPLGRAVAFGIDALIVLAFWMAAQRNARATDAQASLTLLLAAFFVYHFVALALVAGSSMGKHRIGICVVALDGKPPGEWRALVRAATRTAPGLLLLPATRVDSVLGIALASLGSSLFLIACAIDLWLLLASPTRQTIADRAAGTLVVNVPGPEPHRAPALPMFSADDREFGPPPRRLPRR